MTTDNDTFKIAEMDYAKLLEETHSLMLATQGESPTPEASYSPFLRDESGNFYVFVSEMARHTQNLRTGHAASIMVIEDEKTTQQLFARRRATFTCKPEEISRDSEECQLLLGQMRERHGEMIDTLANMGDFHMIKLVPSSGRVVLGFAAAYRVVGDNWDQLTNRVAAGSTGHR
ncbi:MAG: pyridoxamine 5'-phosphate oxidase family protein [Verrucomicrobiota bacterium]